MIVIQNLPDATGQAPLKSAIKSDIAATRNRSVKISPEGSADGEGKRDGEGGGASSERASSAMPDNASAGAKTATPQQRATTTSSGSDSSSDDEAEETSGKVTTKAGYEIDRKSAGNLKRTKEEAAADPEPENQFGYTDRE